MSALQRLLSLASKVFPLPKQAPLTGYSNRIQRLVCPIPFTFPSPIPSPVPIPSPNPLATPTPIPCPIPCYIPCPIPSPMPSLIVSCHPLSIILPMTPLSPAFFLSLPYPYPAIFDKLSSLSLSRSRSLSLPLFYPYHFLNTRRITRTEDGLVDIPRLVYWVRVKG